MGVCLAVEFDSFWAARIIFSSEAFTVTFEFFCAIFKHSQYQRSNATIMAEPGESMRAQ